MYPTIFKLSALLSVMLHSQYAISIHLLSQSKFQGGGYTCFANKNWITIQSSSEGQASNVICSMLPSVKVLPPTKKYCGSLTFWHRSFTFNSNKSPTWCNSFSVYYPDVCLRLNVFRAFSRPSSGAQWLQWQPLVLPSYRGDSCAVFVVGPTDHCSHWAPDDGRENVRNMLSCKQSSG